MHVLVVGGAGYIGSHVVKALLQDGQEVTVFDDMSTGKEENLFSNAKFIKGSILDKEAIGRAMAQHVDGVIFLAAKKAVGESMMNPVKYLNNNIVGAANVLDAMVEHNVPNIIFSSSAAVYGAPENTVIDENTPKKPMNWYGRTKLLMEEMMEGMSTTDALKGKLNYVALRYFNAVGYDEEGQITGLEQNPQNLLPIVMETVMGTRKKMSVYGNDYPTPDGTCIRDYIHVTDLASAHVKALKYLDRTKESRAFNLGTGRGLSVQEMIDATERITGKKVNYDMAPRRPGDPPELVANANLAKEVLGWVATHSSVDNIVASTYRVYEINAQRTRGEQVNTPAVRQPITRIQQGHASTATTKEEGRGPRD